MQEKGAHCIGISTMLKPKWSDQSNRQCHNEVLYDVHGGDISWDKMAITIGDQLVAWRAGRQAGPSILIIRPSTHRVHYS
jgi:hypothetical protein